MKKIAKKIAGLDVGEAKIGVAVMDIEVKIAFPYKVLQRSGAKIYEEIKGMVASEQISQFIVGLPYSEDGSENQQCKKIRNFCRRLAARIEIPIVFFDEYGTTIEAQELLRGKKKDEDAEAAALMLQRYADSELQ